MGDSDQDAYVVFIEDDPAIADMYRLKLETVGCRVAVAPDGEAGLQLVRKTAPDLVFLDVRLPKMDGFAVLELLRRDPQTRGVPVVILSAYSEGEVVERALRLGALDYLVKSSTTPSSLAAVVAARGRRREAATAGRWIAPIRESKPARPAGSAGQTNVGGRQPSSRG